VTRTVCSHLETLLPLVVLEYGEGHLRADERECDGLGGVVVSSLQTPHHCAGRAVLGHGVRGQLITNSTILININSYYNF